MNHTTNTILLAIMLVLAALSGFAIAIQKAAATDAGLMISSHQTSGGSARHQTDEL